MSLNGIVIGIVDIVVRFLWGKKRNFNHLVALKTIDCDVYRRQYAVPGSECPGCINDIMLTFAAFDDEVEKKESNNDENLPF